MNNIQGRVMVLDIDTLSQCTLQMYKVASFFTFIMLKSGHNLNDGQTDGRTDRRTGKMSMSIVRLLTYCEGGTS